MSQSSFYGGRPGVSFKIVKRFDGINIPQISGSIVYKRKEYAYRTIENIDYYLFPFIEKTGSNYQDFNWKICVLDGGNKSVVYSNNTTGIEAVSAKPAEGMIQCFQKGGSSTNEVNYNEYVIIDTITDMCNSEDPDNGKIFRRGTNFNYDSVSNPYYGGELIGNVSGPKGEKGNKGDKGDDGAVGPKGEKGDTGDKGNFNIMTTTYPTAADIPNQPPEVIGGDNRYIGWDVLVGENEIFYLYVYDYLTQAWINTGLFNGSGEDNNNYVVCTTEGNVVEKTVSLSDYFLKTGASLIIKFTNKNTAENPTLNVSNTGSKFLIANGKSAEDVIIANSVFLVIYDGTNYLMVGGAGTGSEKDFIGTTAEWNALSSSEKEKYSEGIVFLTDDGGGVSPSVGGGHIILNSQGVALPQRNRLQFKGATVTDENEITVVEIEEGGESTPIATTEIAGKVKPDGTSITIAEDGTITAIGGGSEVPIATTEIAGKVKPDGSTITITNNGTISAATQTPATATQNSLGIVKPDNSTITISDGVLSAAAQTPATATSSTLGISRPDNSTITINNGVLKTSGIIATERTLTSGGWNSSTKIYDLTSWYPNDSYNIINILPNENTTSEQREAWIKADCGGYRSTNTIKANGTVPTINIVVTVLSQAK